MADVSLFGTVVKGDGIGRSLNYPTANIDIGESRDLDTGVYAGRAVLNGKKYNAAIIVKKDLNKIEAHLINYNGEDFYGNDIEVIILSKVSDIEKLEGRILRDKIEQDMIKVKNFFNV